MDALTCLEQLTRASMAEKSHERQKRIDDVLRSPEFLGFLASNYCYWRGNLYVIKGEISPGNQPIHWHWQSTSDRQLRYRREQKEGGFRIALPFLELPSTGGDLPTEQAFDLRLAIEQEILENTLEIVDQRRASEPGRSTPHRQTTDLSSSYRLIMDLERGDESRGIFREVPWQEIRFFRSVIAGSLGESILECKGCQSPDLEPLSGDAQVDAVWKWISKVQTTKCPSSIQIDNSIKRLFDLFPNPASLGDPSRWKQARNLWNRQPRFKDAMRFSPSESGIEKVGHILCFRAGHIPIRGELSTAYCLLEFTCNLPQDRRFEVISIFREIAHMGALNEALVDNEVTMRRQYVHGFAKPIRAILDCNEDVRYIGNSLVEASTFDGSAAGLGVKLQTLCTITNDIASRIHDQAITALRLSDFPQRFDVAEAVVRETSYFNKSFKNKCIKCNGVSIMVYLPEVYLRALLFQVLLNAKDHGDPKAEIFVGWGLGVDPVVLAESIDLDDKDRETLEKLDRMVGGSDVVLLVHNRRQQSGGIRSGVGLLAIDDMASVLGGRAFHLDNDRSFFSLSIFPDTVVKRSGHGSEEALTGESHQ